MPTKEEEFAEAYRKAMETQDMEMLEGLLREDSVQEWPQSGERLVGKEKIMAVNRAYPGYPSMSLRKVTTRDGLVVSEVDMDYDGDKYKGVSVFELEDGKIVHETDYFAAPFEAPEWRAKWVERM